MLTAFCNSVIVEGIRVYPPRRSVLLCGGEVGTIRDVSPKSLRDAFVRAGGVAALKDCEFLQVEEVVEFFDKASPYDNLVPLERDLAQVCELVLLFPESPGSFAELGTFANEADIADNLLVVIQSRFLTESSFIAKGPIASLKKLDYSVFSFADATVNIQGNNKAGVDGAALVAMLTDPVELRLKETVSRTTCDVSRFNHQCKLFTALLRECYCLKEDELILLLAELGCIVDEVALSRISFCTKALKWTGTATSGFDRVHFAFADLNEAARIDFKNPLRDKLRRRAEFKQWWIDKDPDRVAAVDRELAK